LDRLGPARARYCRARRAVLVATIAPIRRRRRRHRRRGAGRRHVSLRTRIARTSILIIVVGAIATASLFSVVRNDVDKLDRERVDRPAAEALLGVQQLTAAVDQILATGKGVVATSGLDPGRFAAVLAHDVNYSPTDTLAGM